MANHIENPPTEIIHSANCNIWDIPDDSSIPALIECGYENEITASYLANIRPLYDALQRGLAQISGILLMSMINKDRAISLDHQLYKICLEHLLETKDRLRAISSPAHSEDHLSMLKSANEDLLEAIKLINALAVEKNQNAHQTALVTILGKLNFVQKKLIATAEPGANIQPIDFSEACCSCHATQSNGLNIQNIS